MCKACQQGKDIDHRKAKEHKANPRLKDKEEWLAIAERLGI